MRYGQLVIGPAGSGKSTYCSHLVKHCEDARRNICVVNLDPAAEHFDYAPLADIRELIHIDDVMEDEELHLGPNGGLVYCLEHLIDSPEWLHEQLGGYDEDYILFDCPGQIELFTHLDIMSRLLKFLDSLDFKMVSVFILDSQFMIESSKFMSGVMCALATMVNLEVPHVNILSKMDLLNPSTQRNIERFTDPDTHLLLSENMESDKWGGKHRGLTEAIGNLIEDYSLVRFIPFNYKEEESVSDLLLIIDNAIQFGEDSDIKTKDFDLENHRDYNEED